MKYFALLLLILLSCEKRPAGKKEASAKAVKDGIVKAHYKNGSVRAEVPYKGGKKNGKAVEYYQSGKKYMEIDYVDGIKVGFVKRYDDEGVLIEETPYQNGKINGVERKYRSNGRLSTEASYQNDEPCVGLKEFLMDGSARANYPLIVITPIDRVRDKGQFTLKLSLTDKSKRVRFFRGRLTPDGCTSEALDPIYTDEQTGVGEIPYFLSPGEHVMDEVNVIAKVKTLLGNTYVTQKSYNVALDN